MNEALSNAKEALEGLLSVIDAAGLINLSNGVQLGQTVWYVKASEAVEYAREALSALSNLPKLEHEPEGVDYAIKLQRIIEAICNGAKLPESASDLHHYKMAETYLASPCANGKDAEQIIEHIARSWDKCVFHGVGEDIDIGASIREQYAALAQKGGGND